MNYSPKERKIVPVGGSGIRLQPGEHITLDFGIKVAGQLRINFDTDYSEFHHQLEYVYMSDLGESEAMWKCFKDPDWRTGRFPAYVNCSPFGNFSNMIREKGNGHRYLLEDTLSMLRYFQLVNRSTCSIFIETIELTYTAAPYQYVGDFQCSDELINEAWAMGVYTVELCTQPSRFSQRPLTGPYSDYVIWDGVRRDKDIWGGDLRPASLTALYAFDRPEIIKNTLQILLELQHQEGPEEGIIPGSGSYGQIFYEWTLWWIVNLWEYVLHTGDTVYLRETLPNLMRVQGWLERKTEEDEILSGLNSWMYTLDAEGKISGLALAQKAAWDALAAIYATLEMNSQQNECLNRSTRLKKLILQTFHSPESALLTMVPTRQGERYRYSLDGNLWGILHGVIEGNRVDEVLAEIRNQFWRDRGSINIVPVLNEELDGIWWSKQQAKEEAIWRHNNTIWPYMNAYECLARLAHGDTSGGLDVLSRMAKSHLEQGHRTFWEMMPLDGSLPFGHKGDLLSNCHAWGGTGSYALQAYVGGIRPLTPGYQTAEIEPKLGPLDWVKVKVPTPHGIIELEAHKEADGITGIVLVPKGIEHVQVGKGIELHRY